MREHSGNICEMALEVLLCSFYKYPCCDLFCANVEEVLVGHCGHIKILICTGEGLRRFGS